MCTYILEKTEISGSGRSAEGWFGLSEAWVTYDHPFHLPLEHALNIDFVSSGPRGPRLAVELTRESALQLIDAIQAALRRSEEHDGPVEAEGRQAAASA